VLIGIFYLSAESRPGAIKISPSACFCPKAMALDEEITSQKKGKSLTFHLSDEYNPPALFD